MKNLTWPQARALARAGKPIRRFNGGYWFTFETALWILNDSPRRVALAVDFGGAEFTATDWTDEQGENGLPLWPNIGGPIAQIAPGSDSPATGDPVITIALRSSLEPTGEGCLVTVPSTCTIYADVTVTGGPAGVGSADVIVEGVTQTVEAYPGYSATLTFSGVSISAEAELDGSIEYTDSAAFAWPIETTTYTVPAQCPPETWEGHYSYSGSLGATYGQFFAVFGGLPTRLATAASLGYTATAHIDWSGSGHRLLLMHTGAGAPAGIGLGSYADDVILWDSEADPASTSVTIPSGASVYGLSVSIGASGVPWLSDGARSGTLDLSVTFAL